MKLYGTPPTRATRVVWVLRQLGVECEVAFISMRSGDHRRPEFLAKNPAGRVPVFEDGDMVLTESAAICLYLAEKYPEHGLIPSQPQQRAQMYRWLFFAVTEIDAALERIERHTHLYPKDRQLTDEIQLAREDGLRACAVLEQHMALRRYVAGENLSVADLVIGYTLDWASEEHLLVDCPNLRNYKTALYALPSAPPTGAQAIAALQAGQPIDWLKRSWT